MTSSFCQEYQNIDATLFVLYCTNNKTTLYQHQQYKNREEDKKCPPHDQPSSPPSAPSSHPSPPMPPRPPSWHTSPPPQPPSCTSTAPRSSSLSSLLSAATLSVSKLSANTSTYWHNTSPSA